MLCDEGLHRLGGLKRQAVATWHRVEDPPAARDLSREAHDVADRVEGRASAVEWDFGFL